MTEVGLVSIAGPADHGLDPDAVGPVLPGVEVRVVDEAGRALPPDEEGLLRFRSAGMVTGYLDDPEATARGFPDGWFQPGDVGRLTASGQLRVAGRRDDRMTLGVIKIMPAEIEAVAERFPGVRDCAAFALPSRGLGDIPMLAAVAEPGVDAAALLAHCRAALGMRAPRKVVLVPALPRNAAGKVLRRDLVAMARG
jgi:long-chain acyl-CoA synthetase